MLYRIYCRDVLSRGEIRVELHSLCPVLGCDVECFRVQGGFLLVFYYTVRSS